MRNTHKKFCVYGIQNLIKGGVGWIEEQWTGGFSNTGFNLVKSCSVLAPAHLTVLLPAVWFWKSFAFLNFSFLIHKWKHGIRWPKILSALNFHDWDIHSHLGKPCKLSGQGPRLFYLLPYTPPLADCLVYSKILNLNWIFIS